MLGWSRRREAHPPIMEANPYRSPARPNRSGRRCPRCGDRGAGLVGRYLGEFEIEECGDCRGQWFGRELFGNLVMDPAVRRAVADRARLARARVVDDVGLRCPMCAQTMTRKEFGGSSAIHIDICNRHGVWLDDGELHDILEFLRRTDDELTVGREQEPEEDVPELGDDDRLLSPSMRALAELELARHHRTADKEESPWPTVLAVLGYIALRLLLGR